MYAPSHMLNDLINVYHWGCCLDINDFGRTVRDAIETYRFSPAEAALSCGKSWAANLQLFRQAQVIQPEHSGARS